VKRFLFCLSASAVSFAASSNAQTAEVAAPIELYGGLLRGMSPEVASQTALTLDGVKSTKVKKQKLPVEAMCVDVSHNMASGGAYGGLQGYPVLECDNLGLKAVKIRFSEGKNAYRELLPHCLSEASAIYLRLEELLRSKYEVTAQSDLEINSEFVDSARSLAAREKLEVTVGRKRMGQLNIPSPYIVFSDGERAIVLTAGVKNWSFYEGQPFSAKMAQAKCSVDGGLQALPELTYITMQDLLKDQKMLRDDLEQGKAARDNEDAKSL
jgi:hypothetical protein